MAFGIRRKQELEEEQMSVQMNAPFAFALGSGYKTNKAKILEFSQSGLRFLIPMTEELPEIHFFFDIPISFRLPKDKDPWNMKIDITRIYAFDEKDRAVYGVHAIFKDVSKEQYQRIMEYLENSTGGQATGPKRKFRKPGRS